MSEQLDRIEKQLAAIAAHLGIGARQAAPTVATVASGHDLDGEYGNPEVRRDPKDWRGPSMVGRRFSDCPPEFLDMVAALNDWRARKDDEAGARGEVGTKGKPKDGHFARLDAARARGWAARARASVSSGGSARWAGHGSEPDDLPF